MNRNSFIYSLQTVLKAVLGVIMAGILLMLFLLYSELSFINSLITSIFYVCYITFSVSFYLKTFAYIPKPYFKIFLVVLIQIFPVVLLYLINYIFKSSEDFLMLIPLLLVYGFMEWIILIQIQDNRFFRFQTEEEIEKSLEESDSLQIEELKEAEIDTIDRISVKQGADIHIIKVNDIDYFEAYGDYVLIHSEKEKYIKESTMRYYETYLPAHFIRIHRSFIVNTDRILRIELFGKESYNVRLKNGVNLKTSNNGYKLLKKKLSL